MENEDLWMRAHLSFERTKSLEAEREGLIYKLVETSANRDELLE